VAEAAGVSRKSVGPWGNFSSGLKLSGERDVGLGLARFLAVCPLGGHVRKWPSFVVRMYGRCCMYGPNYVELSRVFAVQLFRGPLALAFCRGGGRDCSTPRPVLRIGGRHLRGKEEGREAGGAVACGMAMACS
jgi:hypothetical protein